jgi:integrase
MTYQRNRLTALKVKTLDAPGLYADGGGLYLRIGPSGAKSWVFRYQHNRKSHDMGLGPAWVVDLKSAREKMLSLRRGLVLEGIDPLAARRATREPNVSEVPTFKTCCEQFLADRESNWSVSNREQWRESLFETCKLIAALPVDQIDTPQILAILKPMWSATPTTASRVRGRIERVLAWAKVQNYRSGDNPARWKDHLEFSLAAIADAKLAAREENGNSEHHSALPWQQLPKYMAALREYERDHEDSDVAFFVELTILTALRAKEARLATFEQVDWERRLLTIRGKTKSHPSHVVPLPEPALALLRRMQEHHGRTTGRIFECSPNAARMGVMASIGAKDPAGNLVTLHGFRSSFRDWAAENGQHEQAAEFALQHRLPKGSTEAAYFRSSLLDLRRDLMAAWAAFVT